MKKFTYIIFLILALFFLLPTAKSQFTDDLGFNYQAVARDQNGQILVMTSLIVEISVYNALGTLIYQEGHQVITNAFGLFDLVIGHGITTGTAMYNSFGDISWEDSYHSISVRIDLGNGLIDMGSSQLQSVPYAKIAEKTSQPPDMGLVDLNDIDLSTISPNSLLIWNGSHWISSEQINLSTIQSDSLQVICITSGSISTDSLDSKIIDAISITANNISADSISAGFINTQSFQLSQNAVSGAVLMSDANGNGNWQLAGGDISGAYSTLNVNKIQGRTVAGTQPGNNQILKWNGNQWTPSNDNNTTYGAGNGISISGNQIHFIDTVYSGDLTGNHPSPMVKGIRGKTVSVISPQHGEVLKFDTLSNAYLPVGGLLTTGDSVGGDLYGNYSSPRVVGIQGRAVSIAVPSNGQVLIWDNIGSNWVPSSAGGDAVGELNNLNVVGLRGRSIVSTTPTHGDVLQYDANNNTWRPFNLHKITQVNTNNTLGVDDHVILVNNATGTTTVSLQSATVMNQKCYTIKNMNINSVIIDAYTNETIDGSQTFTLSNQYDYIEILSNGSEWLIIGRN